MNITNSLKEYKEQVNIELENFFYFKAEQYTDLSEPCIKALESLREFTMRGGKRLRAALVYYSYLLFKPSEYNNKDLIRISTFTELLQSYLLIHDDIIDRDELRRGKLTVHKVFEKAANILQVHDKEHFGVSMAILLGDLANQFTFDIITDSNFDITNKDKLLVYISKLIAETIYGQLLDIQLEHKENYTENDILLVSKDKTAKYTFEAPLLAGAILTGASDEHLNILSEYSIPAGIAFQIRDDILGIFGDQSKTGKSDFSDIREGKKTLLILKAYEGADKEQKATLDRFVGKQDISKEEAEEVKNVIRMTNSLDYSVTLCREKVAEARKVLEKLPNHDSEGWQFLDSIAEYIIVREI